MNWCCVAATSGRLALWWWMGEATGARRHVSRHVSCYIFTWGIKSECAALIFYEKVTDDLVLYRIEPS